MDPTEAANILGIVPGEPTVPIDPAMTPMVIPELEAPKVEGGSSLKDRLASAPKPDPTAPRRRGRPPGSKNRTTLEREANEGIRPPPGPGAKIPSTGRVTAPKPGQELTPEQKREHKRHRAEELSDKVADAVNENIMLLLISMGAPPELLYKPGHIPAKVTEHSKYTPIGAQLTLDKMQSNILGHFLAELEATDMGGKAAGIATDGKGPLVIYGILSVATVLQYGKGLMEAYANFKPLLEQYEAQQRVTQQQDFNSQQATGG